MNKHHIERADLYRMQQIAHVSSETPDKKVWTELGVYYRPGHDRPFVAAVIGGVNASEQRERGLVPRLRTMAAGTLDRALNWFEESGLRDQLLAAVPDDADSRFPDREQRRATDAVGAAIKEAIADGVLTGMRSVIDPVKMYEQAAADTAFIRTMEPGAPLKLRIVGLTTTSLREALTWLFPDAEHDSALSLRMERHFNIPARTVRRALQIEGAVSGEQGAWVGMFLKTMECFDRELWEAGLATVAKVER